MGAGNSTRFNEGDEGYGKKINKECTRWGHNTLPS